MDNWIVNNSTGRIEFLDARFYRDASGAMVPSVTTILDATYPKGAAYFEWLKRAGEDADEIRDEAGKRGSIVHNLTESLDYGAEVSMCDPGGGPKYKMMEWAMVERYVEFRKMHKPVVTDIELNMVDASLGFAGTLDRVMMIGDDLWIIDLKTSNAVYDQYELQLIAYWQLYCKLRKVPEHEALKIRLGVLHLNAKTKTYGKGEAIQGPGWQLVETWNTKEFLSDVWGAQLVTWNAVKSNVKPKAMSYALTLKVEQPQTVEQ